MSIKSPVELVTARKKNAARTAASGAVSASTWIERLAETTFDAIVLVCANVKQCWTCHHSLHVHAVNRPRRLA